MKTKITLTLLAFTAISFDTIRAEEVLVDKDGDGFAETIVNLNQLDGGADDDQIVGGDGADFVKPVYKGLVSDPLGLTGDKLCGGADDDQIVGGGDADFLKPVFKGLVTDPLGLTGDKLCGGMDDDQIVGGGGKTDTLLLQVMSTGSLSGSNGANRLDGGADDDQVFNIGDINGDNDVSAKMSTNSGGWTRITGDSGADTLWGDNGTDSLLGGNGAAAIVTKPVVKTGIESDPFGISGGSLDNLKSNQQIDQAILQLMSTGSLHGNDGDDTLWGGGGTDEIVVVNPSGGSI